MAQVRPFLDHGSIPGEEFSALVMAYSAIGNAEIRKALLELVETIAGGQIGEVVRDRLIPEWT